MAKQARVIITERRDYPAVPNPPYPKNATIVAEARIGPKRYRLTVWMHPGGKRPKAYQIIRLRSDGFWVITNAPRVAERIMAEIGIEKKLTKMVD